MFRQCEKRESGSVFVSLIIISISATMSVSIMKQKPKDAHISKLMLIKCLNQSAEHGKQEIYPNSENLQHFKLTFVRHVFKSIRS